VPTLLGLDGKVDGEQLTAMLTGNSPIDGEPLGLRAVGGRGPVPGFDLTFSAPKSVSVTWALGGAASAPRSPRPPRLRADGDLLSGALGLPRLSRRRDGVRPWLGFL
jgi:TrwC relaxase